ncbi:MAG: hypothetical protein J6B43_02580 [Lachnospiraceae bacterium]|nr:hypothetical protein [Lachnospiraceae bacterium]
MKWKKLMALGCMTVMALTLVTGCGADGNDNTSDSIIEESTVQTEESTEEAESTQETVSTVEEEAQETVLTVQVTEVDGNTVIAQVGELRMQEAPDGELPDGETPDGEAADGERPDGEAPAGEQPAGEKPRGGSNFAASEETITFTMTEETAVTADGPEGSSDGTLEDVVAGAVLEVTLDENDNAVKIVVKSLNAGEEPGSEEETTDGAAANTVSKAEDVAYTSKEI